MGLPDMDPSIYSNGEAVPLVAGHLYGSRTFAVNKDGKLTAVSWDYEWEPGENVAECKALDESSDPFGKQVWQLLTAADPELEEKMNKRRNHDISTCPTHGFYAYTDGSNDWHHNLNQVRGVIKAYGKVHEGSKGFRAEKAEIVGLVLPHKKPWYSYLWSTKNDPTPTHRAISAVVYFLIFMSGYSYIGNTSGVGNTLIGLLICFIGLVVLWRSLPHIESVKDRIYQIRTGMTSKQAYAKIRENYPDVKIFNTNREMLKHFNLKKG